MSGGYEFKDPVIGELVKFIMSPTFQDDFEAFFVKHASKFSQENEEQTLECTQIYQQFQELFDRHIKTFLKDQDLDEDEFLVHVREADKSDPSASEYLSMIHASMEYSSFVSLMVLMKPAEPKQNLSGKRNHKELDDDDEMESEEKDAKAEAKGSKEEDDDTDKK